MRIYNPLFALLLVGFLGTQCQRKAVPADPVAVPAVSDANARISLRTTACFGRCPVYEFSIDGTGKATFNGKRFTDRLGRYERTFSAAETKALFAAFADADFFGYEDAYTDDVTDLPNRYLGYTRGKQSKEIRLYAREPDALRRLEQMVSRAALETQGWKAAAEKM